MLVYAYKAGLDLNQVIRAINGGGAHSFLLGLQGPKMVSRDFAGFPVDLFLKDLGISLNEAKRLNLSLPTLSLVNQLYIALKAEKGGDISIHAIINVLENMNGITNGINNNKE